MSWLEPIQNQGFAVIPGILTLREVDELLEELSRVELPRSRAGVRHAMKVPAVATVAQDARLMGIARETLGEQAVPFRATIFDKSPTANWLVVWHQDTALPLRERRDVPGWGPWSVKDGVIYAQPLIVHASSKSQSDSPRRVRHIEYAASQTIADGVELAIA